MKFFLIFLGIFQITFGQTLQQIQFYHDVEQVHISLYSLQRDQFVVNALASGLEAEGSKNDQAVNDNQDRINQRLGLQLDKIAQNKGPAGQKLKTDVSELSLQMAIMNQELNDDGYSDSALYAYSVSVSYDSMIRTYQQLATFLHSSFGVSPQNIIARPRPKPTTRRLATNTFDQAANQAEIEINEIEAFQGVLAASPTSNTDAVTDNLGEVYFDKNDQLYASALATKDPKLSALAQATFADTAVNVDILNAILGYYLGLTEEQIFMKVLIDAYRRNIKAYKELDDFADELAEQTPTPPNAPLTIEQQNIALRRSIDNMRDSQRELLVLVVVLNSRLDDDDYAFNAVDEEIDDQLVALAGNLSAGSPNQQQLVAAIEDFNVQIETMNTILVQKAGYKKQGVRAYTYYKMFEAIVNRYAKYAHAIDTTIDATPSDINPYPTPGKKPYPAEVYAFQVASNRAQQDVTAIKAFNAQNTNLPDTGIEVEDASAFLIPELADGISAKENLDIQAQFQLEEAVKDFVANVKVATDIIQARSGYTDEQILITLSEDMTESMLRAYGSLMLLALRLPDQPPRIEAPPVPPAPSPVVSVESFEQRKARIDALYVKSTRNQEILIGLLKNTVENYPVDDSVIDRNQLKFYQFLTEFAADLTEKAPLERKLAVKSASTQVRADITEWETLLESQGQDEDRVFVGALPVLLVSFNNYLYNAALQGAQAQSQSPAQT